MDHYRDFKTINGMRPWMRREKGSWNLVIFSQGIWVKKRKLFG
jgi:hypothetical protein